MQLSGKSSRKCIPETEGGGRKQCWRDSEEPLQLGEWQLGEERGVRAGKCFSRDHNIEGMAG